MLDIDAILKPISDEAPAGADMSYDPAYQEFEDLARGTPERSIGDTVIPATPPDWNKVLEKGTSLLKQTHDLRLLVRLTVARTAVKGLEGLTDALALLTAAVDRNWQQMHPALDADDPEAIERINALQSLSVAPGGFADEASFVRRVMEIPLTDSRQLGRFSLRDFKVATGDMAAGSGAEVPDSNTVDAAFQDTSTEHLQASLERTAAARESLNTLRKSIIDHVGAGSAADFSELDTTLIEISSLLEEHLRRRGIGVAAPIAGSDDGTGRSSAPGEIRSRHDVVAALDRICQYYDQAEPASPVPLLLRRAQRLAHKSFVEIVRDLTPNALDEIERIGGEKYGE
ncbi:MAG: type VI secretion system protein TssA [Phycisphaerales bacterium]